MYSKTCCSSKMACLQRSLIGDRRQLSSLLSSSGHNHSSNRTWARKIEFLRVEGFCNFRVRLATKPSFPLIAVAREEIRMRAHITYYLGTKSCHYPENRPPNPALPWEAKPICFFFPCLRSQVKA